MSAWIVLTKAGAKSEPVAVNLDQATSMVQLEHTTRIVFGQADTVEVAQSVSDILSQADAKRTHRT